MGLYIDYPYRESATTLANVQADKKQFEAFITGALVEFEERTNLSVERLTVIRLSGGRSVTCRCGIEVKAAVNLP